MSLKDQLQILVVDDMSTSRGLITQALDEMGVRNYRTENDGQSAYASLAARPVHLIISDFNMPEMDGLQLLEAVRRSPGTARVGFILITGRADKQVIERGAALALNNYIAKPFTTQGLQSCIEQVVGKI